MIAVSRSRAYTHDKWHTNFLTGVSKMSRTAPDGRKIFRWSGKDRKQDLAALADAIAEVVDGLCNYNDGIARLGEDGKLSPISFDRFRLLVEQHICTARVVQSGSEWEWEYRPFAFSSPPGPDFTRGGVRPEGNQEPDSTVLDEIYRIELVKRLPPVELQTIKRAVGH